MNVKAQRGLLLVALIVAVGTLAVGALLLSVGVSSPAEAQSLQTQQPSTPPADASAAETTSPKVNAAETTEHQQPPDFSQLLQQAEQEGSVRVIAHLSTDFAPEGRQSRPEVADQRAEIASDQAGLQSDLQGSGYQTLRQFDTVPYIALDVSPQALQAAQGSPHVTDIVEDRLDQPSQVKEASEDLDSPLLDQSSPLVQASEMWEAGYTGDGQVVAVLDTGVDNVHPFLADKVIEEACFSAESDCPNGFTEEIGEGAGVDCDYATACDHGTHVAGIAAGRGNTFSGVARDADLMSVQVFSELTCGGNPCARSYASDQIAGLERVYALRETHDFSSVNMSIGGGKFESNCDTDSRKAIIDNLRSAGIATVIASGNNAYTNATNSPGCISSAVSVGSTTKSDALSSFSNSASFLHLLAPGSTITSSVPGGGFAVMNGTSMAAPHVAGAWALLKDQSPTASVSSLLSSLQRTGTLVTDTRVTDGLRKPRINIFDASGPANDDFVDAQALTGFSVTATGTNVDATKEVGEPNHHYADNRGGGKSVWYKWTPRFSDPTTIDTAGSNFDTLLAVYTGSAVNSLSKVASNDDENNAGGVQTSKLRFAAKVGTTYWIAVDGYNNGAGAESGTTLKVQVRQPPRASIIVFASKRVTATNPTGDYEIYSIKPDGGDLRQLTTNGTDDNEPVISPDGTRIAYTNTKTLYVMSVDGSNNRILSRDMFISEEDPTWSPDGTKIAFAAQRCGCAENPGVQDIWTIDANPASTSPMTQLTSTDVYELDPAWSPDGTKIAYVSEDNRDASDGGDTLSVMRADGTEQTVIRQPRFGGWGWADPAWSPDGRRIAMTTSGPDGYQIAAINSDGSNEEFLTPYTQNNHQPAWSPDGSKMAFASDRDDAHSINDSEIYTADITNLSAATRLTFDLAQDSQPDWGALSASFGGDPERPLESDPPGESDTTITSGPSGSVSATTASFGFSSSATKSTFECSLDGATFSACTSPKEYSGLANGERTFRVRAVSADGIADPTPASRTWTVVDTAAPKVSSVTPANNATGVKRNTNLTATFSEKMNPSTLTTTTFQLFKVNTDGSTTQIANVTVTPSTDGLKATLNPFGTSTTLLAKSTRYKAVVTTGAKDVAGNPLDQNPTTSGNQQMVWSFKSGLQ
jgi:subtilisin